MSKRTFFSILLLASITSVTFAQALKLFGGVDHDVYLGCLNSGKFDSNSVWNQLGTYGSKFSPNSIWNQFGTYGSKFSNDSPWNEFASDPPVIVDSSGNFYGCSRLQCG